MPRNATANLDRDPDYQEELIRERVNPERRLLAAVLMRAIVDCCTRTFVSADAQRTARAYIFSKGPSRVILSFEYVCRELDLEPETVRQTVKDIKKGVKELPAFVGQRH